MRHQDHRQMDNFSRVAAPAKQDRGCEQGEPPDQRDEGEHAGAHGCAAEAGDAAWLHQRLQPLLQVLAD